MFQPKWFQYLDIRGVLALLVTILCWGSVPVMLRELTHVIDPWTANGIRFPLAAVLYWPVLVVAYRRGALTRHTVRQCLIPTACILTGQFFWAAAPYYLPASSIGFMVRFTMVFSILFAMIFIREERRLLGVPAFYLGLTISIAGFIGLAMSQGFDSDAVRPFGILCILLCSLSLGLYAVSIRIFLKDIHPALSFGVIAQFVSICLLVTMFSQGNWRAAGSLSTSSWGLLIFSSLLGIAMSHTMMYVAIHRLGPSITAGIGNVTPFLTVVLAMMFLGEKMTTVQWLAGVTLALGAGWLLRSHAIMEKNEAKNLP